MLTPDEPPARVTLDIETRRRRDDPLRFIIRIVNDNDFPVDLYLGGRDITYDVIVSRRNGPVVWQRLEGQIIPAILRIETIGPLESIELVDEWNLRDNAGRHVGTGSYTMKAVILTDGTMSLESPNVAFELHGR